MSTLGNTIYNLGWVIAFWEDLSESRLPGTVRPWRQMILTGEQAEERDYQVRLERFDAISAMPGEHPAPIDLRVLDLMRGILTEAENLAWIVASNTRWGTFHWPGSPRPGIVDARPYLELARQHITEDLAEYAAPITGRMATQVAHALSLISDGQTLNIVCPWCRGVTPESPAGGERTWRIRVLPGDQIAIVCEGVCEPPGKDVGTWWRGRPCWPLNSWRWLAKRVHAADTREKMSA